MIEEKLWGLNMAFSDIMKKIFFGGFLQQQKFELWLKLHRTIVVAGMSSIRIGPN